MDKKNILLSEIVPSSDLAYFDNLQKNNISSVEILRVGTIHAAKNLKITMPMLVEMLQNFNNNSLGQQIPVNSEHDRTIAFGWIKSLYISGESLFATIEWTTKGVEMICEELYKYVSIEFYEKRINPKDGKEIRNQFVAIALTNVPAMKDQAPLMLSEIKASENTKNSNIILTNNNMFEKLLLNLLGKTDLSESDYNLAVTLHETLPEEDKTAFAEKMGELKTKLSEVLAKEKAEKEAEAKEKDKKETLSEDQVSKIQLAEKVAMLEKEVAEKNELAERVALLEAEKTKTALSEKVDSSVMLSESREVGVTPAKRETVVDFMVSLSEDQRTVFLDIMGNVAQFSVKEHGKAVKAQDDSITLSENTEKAIAEINEKAQKLSESRKISLEEAVGIATDEYFSSKM